VIGCCLSGPHRQERWRPETPCPNYVTQRDLGRAPGSSSGGCGSSRNAQAGPRHRVLPAARLTPKNPGTTALLVLLPTAGELTALATNAPYPLLLTAVFTAGTGSSIFGVLWITALQHHIPTNTLGRVLALDALGNSALQSLDIGTSPLWRAFTIVMTSTLTLRTLRYNMSFRHRFDSRPDSALPETPYPFTFVALPTTRRTKPDSDDHPGERSGRPGRPDAKKASHQWCEAFSSRILMMFQSARAQSGDWARAD